MKQIQPEGPFTIIGETWGGTIAVELTKIIEGFGDTVNLILLDGCPSDNKKRLKLFDNIDFELLNENAEKKVVQCFNIFLTRFIYEIVCRKK